MGDTGFAIRCPHCFEWSDWPDQHPKDLVVTAEEQEEILKGLRDDPLKFSHDKMLHCKNGPGRCPCAFRRLSVNPRKMRIGL